MKTILLVMALCALPAAADQRYFGIKNADISGPALATVSFTASDQCQWIIGHRGKACKVIQVVFAIGGWRIGALCTGQCYPVKDDPGCTAAPCSSHAWLEIQNDNVTLGVKFASDKSERPEKLVADKRFVRRWQIIRVTNAATGFDPNKLTESFDDAMTK